MQKLDTKLSLLYRFEPTSSGYKWKIEEQFELKANYDAEPGELPSRYQVSWGDIVQDLNSTSDYFYESAKERCNSTERRDLHALVNFKYEGIFANLRNI